MTLRAFMLIRRISVLLACVLVLGGCDTGTPLTKVKAVAAGVPSLAPFFDEGSGLGKDTTVRSQAVRGGLQQGDTPGLYGGTREPTLCDVAKLKAFLTNPRNRQKAQAWATALDLTTAEIPDYLDRLTPVLLRHDTLVKNHDYKKGKAVPFNSLLQAGIAILVDQQGLPAVKCSCGNPLRPFEGDTDRISVTFDDGNKKWQGYERSSVVAVRPAPRKMAKLALVDVDDPDTGISRPVGTTGRADTTFDTRELRAVPLLAGTTFGEASLRLADQGLATGYGGQQAPAADARVTASDPPAGTELRFGQYVTLTAVGGSSSGSGTSGGGTSGGGSTPPPPPSVSDPPSKAPPSSPSGSGTGGSSSAPPSSGPPSSGPPTSNPPPSSKPPDSTPPTTTVAPPPDTLAPPPPRDPVTTSAPPPPSDPVTTSAPPPPGDPVTSSVPGTTEPASSGPASSASA
ncbi:PASTA domain-containing protein [Streptomyces pseudovenezuelae]|uniref:DUF6777 domain-containing protein n=1 Tax=Streptomyces pseudovenezuelae TaxID=67350 RepID=A0ABT6LPG3_9ACTN|nr:PASTA domain-containing protein [Streptomyces pseudovenezuelae]MDH6218157.1 hypothetical protein [Streptomyces pseudovenezuelae]